MANAAAKMFTSLLEARDMKYELLDEEKGLVRTGFTLENTKLKIYIEFGEKNSDVHLVGLEFVQVPEDKIESMFKVCNACNQKFRWLKFIVDEKDKTISAEADGVIQLDSCAEETFELMCRMATIVDKAYPMFMKSLWA